ncbi:hypothetical protein N0V95_007940 [Ascochyta clinopodiicola]|nr:hypothetical protein N0V95_007940 [Ascochyta clinopodiicola]
MSTQTDVCPTNIQLDKVEVIVEPTEDKPAFVSDYNSHTWTGASLGPLKNTLRNELGITNTQFGVISASDAVVNSIWPIIGGLLLDHFGPNIIVLCCTGVVLVGSMMAGVAVNIGKWRLLAGGHIFMGFGIAVLDSATQKFFYHWFGVGGLALAFGLESAVSRTVDLVVRQQEVP